MLSAEADCKSHRLLGQSNAQEVTPNRWLASQPIVAKANFGEFEATSSSRDRSL